jgi:hypothetical protein
MRGTLRWLGLCYVLGMCYLFLWPLHMAAGWYAEDGEGRFLSQVRYLVTGLVALFGWLLLLALLIRLGTE